MFEFLSQKFSTIFSNLTGNSHLTEKNMGEALAKVRDSLLEADVPYHVVETFIQEVQQEALGKKVTTSFKPGEQFIKIVHEKLKFFLGGQSVVEFSFQLPATALIMGLQGSGKTTSAAKIAYWANQQAKKRGKTRNILLASVDFYRPAAVDQLEILARSVGVDFYRSSAASPVQAAADIQSYAKKHGYELLFLDTAGRLHIDQGMMEELKAIHKAVAPRYGFLVLDAMTGQESLAVAQQFQDAVGYTGAVLTKMDSGTRAGAAFAFRYVQKKPIIFVGTGEKIDQLEFFHPDRMAGRILGMGDMLTLLEKAEAAFEKAEQEKAQASFIKGQMTLQDFADQLSMMGKLGSMSQLVKYLPGAPAGLTPDKIEQGEKDIKKFRAILSSMTIKERFYPRILDASRKKRIAQGAGVAVADIHVLLERFEQTQQYAKLFKKLGKNNGLFR